MMIDGLQNHGGLRGETWPEILEKITLENWGEGDPTQYM